MKAGEDAIMKQGRIPEAIPELQLRVIVGPMS